MGTGKFNPAAEFEKRRHPFQPSVKSSTSTPPTSPGAEDRYLVGANPTGAWAGHENDVAEWMGDRWEFWTPELGWALRVEDEDAEYKSDGTDWASSSLGMTDVFGSNYVAMPINEILLASEGMQMGMNRWIDVAAYRIIGEDLGDGVGIEISGQPNQEISLNHSDAIVVWGFIMGKVNFGEQYEYETCVFEVKAVFKRNVGVTSQVGSTTKTAIAQDSNLGSTDVLISADTINHAVDITVTGINGSKMSWIADLIAYKITG